MKTTLNVDASVMRKVKQEAARRGRTMSELVEAALRNFFKEPSGSTKLPPLPTFNGGGALVDVSDREALDRAMEGD